MTCRCPSPGLRELAPSPWPGCGITQPRANFIGHICTSDDDIKMRQQASRRRTEIRDDRAADRPVGGHPAGHRIRQPLPSGKCASSIMLILSFRLTIPHFFFIFSDLFTGSAERCERRRGLPLPECLRPRGKKPASRNTHVQNVNLRHNNLRRMAIYK